MNINRFCEITAIIQDYENRHKIQSQMSEVLGYLSSIASNPTESSYQASYAQSLDKLDKTLVRLDRELEPREVAVLKEIGGLAFFSTSITERIRKWVKENPASISVAVTGLSSFVNKRSEFVSNVNAVQSVFEKFGIDVDNLEEGSAEIGFLLPRDLFSNNLPNLIKELSTINNIVRIFSEVALGEVEEIEVRDISTSDPIFFLALAASTIALVGKAVTWALDTWERVENIRKVRAEIATLEETKSRPEMEQLLTNMIKETIEKKIVEYSDVLLNVARAEEARKHELRNHLDWALQSILSRIERGMVVEIRLLPPPVETDENGAEKPAPQAFQDIEKVISEMVFPRLQGTPVLQLPPSEPPKEGGPKGADKAAKRS